MTALSADLSALQAAHPRWHAWLSDAGRIWAAIAWPDGSGATVDGGTPETVAREIARAERDHITES